MDQAERIKKFIPEPFWKVEPVIFDSDSKKNYTLKWGRGKVYDRNVARVLHSVIATEKEAYVVNVQKSTQT